MKRLRWSKICLISLFLTAVWLVHSGYVVDTLDNATFTKLFWNTANFPIRIQIWKDFTDQLPMVEDGSSPKVAIREALERWVRVSSLAVVLGEETSAQDAGTDNINLVTVADTTANKNAVGAAAGVSVKLFEQNTGRIIEADVVLNPTKTWTTLEASDPSADVTNIFDVTLHEFGHNWDLNHAISRSSTMFFSGGAFDFGFNDLSWDDIAGTSVTYPMVGLEQITGTIRGKVTRSGSVVFAAFVLALDDQGVLVSNAITLPDGTYEIKFLPPGNYTLYVEPLDGPATEGSVKGGVFERSGKVTDFLPKFYQDSMSPSVSVAPGSITPNINFQVTQGQSRIDPPFLAAETTIDGFKTFSTRPAEANQAAVSSFVGVAGKGADKLLDNGGLFLLSDEVVAGSLAGTGKLDNEAEDPVRIYNLSVSLDAPKGEYPLFLKTTDNELGVVSGGLEVFSRFRFLQAFAQFADIPGIASGLFLINTNLNEPAVGKISARVGVKQADDVGVPAGSRVRISLGSLQADQNNDLDFQLSPGGALSVTTPTDGKFEGSVRAEADRRIGGTVLFDSPFGTTGVGGSRPLYTFLAPLEIKNGGDFNTGVNTGFAITNLEERAAKIFIRVHNQNGQPLGEKIIDVAANSHLARFITEEFSSLPANLDGTFIVTANRKIGATVIALRPGVFTTFPIVQNRTSPQSFFAQFFHDSSNNFFSRLILLNPSPLKAANVTIQVRDQSGNPASLTLSGQPLPQGTKTVFVPALGSIILETQSNVAGSVEVLSQDIPVGGVVLFSGPGIGTAGVGESFPQKDVVLPLDRATGSGIDTGIAILNVRDQPVNVDLTVRDLNGAIPLPVKTITLQPRQRIAAFPNDPDLGLGVPNTFQGSLWISAEAEVAAMSIRLSPGVFTTFPVIPLEQFITPAD